MFRIFRLLRETRKMMLDDPCGTADAFDSIADVCKRRGWKRMEKRNRDRAARWKLKCAKECQ